MNSCPSLIPWLCLTMFLFMIQGLSDQSLINSTCKTLTHNDPNIDYAFCVTSLQAVPGSHCTTLPGMGKISIELVLQNVTETRCYIKQLMKKGGWDQYATRCLSDCLELFSDALPTVERALSYYDARRFDDANVQISSVMDAASTCQDGFEEKGGAVSPLTKRNNDTFMLSAVAISVMHMIQTGSG